jgi:hypothetical protein
MLKAYATLAQLKSFSSNTTTLNDPDLLRILEDASDEIDSLCFRHFNTWEGTMYFDGAGQVFIPDEDILSISEIDLDIDGSGSYATKLSSSDYLMYPLGGPFQYPKNMLKTTMSSGVGYFASGIRAGVKVIGVFGFGNGLSATPYYDSGLTGTVATASGTTLTLSAENTIQAGHTLRIETEQLYVQAVTNNGTKTATVVRGANGTTGAIHATAEIYIYSYPGPIVEATILLANRDWKRKESPVQAVVGSAELGLVPVTKGIDPDVTAKLKRYTKKKII